MTLIRRCLLWVSRDAGPMFSLGLLYPLPADGIAAPPRNVAMCQKLNRASTDHQVAGVFWSRGHARLMRL